MKCSAADKLMAKYNYRDKHTSSPIRIRVVIEIDASPDAAEETSRAMHARCAKRGVSCGSTRS
jgi:hypothetical protein